MKSSSNKPIINTLRINSNGTNSLQAIDADSTGLTEIVSYSVEPIEISTSSASVTGGSAGKRIKKAAYK